MCLFAVCVVTDVTVTRSIQLFLLLFLLNSPRLQYWTSLQPIMGITAALKIEIDHSILNQNSYENVKLFSPI